MIKTTNKSYASHSVDTNVASDQIVECSEVQSQRKAKASTPIGHNNELIDSPMLITRVASTSPCNATKNRLKTQVDYSNLIRVVLIPMDFLNLGSKKIQFLQQNNCQFGIEASTVQDVQSVIDFIKDPDTQSILHRLTSVTFGDIDPKNIGKIQELINLLAFQCPNINVFSCGDIEIHSDATLTLPEELNNLTYFSCGNISSQNRSSRDKFPSPLILPQRLSKLTSFSCGFISGIFMLPKELPNLISFSCGNICDNDLTLPSELPNLVSFSCKQIFEDVSLIFPKKLPRLISFSCDGVRGRSSGNIQVIFPEDLPSLTTFSCGTIYANATFIVPSLPSLTSLSCHGIYPKGTLILPTEFRNPISFSCGKIDEGATLTLTNQNSISFENIKEYRSEPMFEIFQGKLVLILTLDELFDPNNPKLQFVKDNDFKIEINTDDTIRIQNFIDFIKNPDNATLLRHLKAIYVEQIRKKNIDQIEKLINLLPSKCSNLISFSCGEIWCNVNLTFLEELPNLISFSCDDLWHGAVVVFPKKLPKLTSFSCGSNGCLDQSATLMIPSELDSLISFSCKHIYEPFTLPKELPNLTSFSCKDILPYVNFTFPQKLNNLISFSCGDIYNNNAFILPEELPNLTSFSCGNVDKNVDFKIPNQLLNLDSISFREVTDGRIKTVLEGLQLKLKLKGIEKSLKICQELSPSNYFDVAVLLKNASDSYFTFGDRDKALEYKKQAYSIYSSILDEDHEQTKQIKSEIVFLQPNFFIERKIEQALQQKNCLGGNKVGPEYRSIIFSRGETDNMLIIVKQKIQANVLDNIVKAVVDKYGWSYVNFLNIDWGVKGYMEKSYLSPKLGALGNKDENIETAQMLCFEAMNMGIMKSEQKPYDIVIKFTKANSELVKKIAVKHPEFFVDASIVEACVEAMQEDKSFEKHIFAHVQF